VHILDAHIGEREKDVMVDDRSIMVEGRERERERERESGRGSRMKRWCTE
jgi:hypothetical protein